MAELTRKQKFQLGWLVAGIAVIGSVLSASVQAFLSSFLEAPKLRHEVAALTENLTKKSTELQQLQTEFIPFKTIAFQKFTGTEAERLAQLALLLNDVQNGMAILEERQKQASMTTAAIQDRLARRHVTEQQSRIFAEALREIPRANVEVTYGTPEDETIRFAEDVRKMMATAGFNRSKGVVYWVGVGSDASGTWDVGIAFGGEELPALANSLRKALNAAGISTIYVRGGLNLNNGEVKFLIHAKG